MDSGKLARVLLFGGVFAVAALACANGKATQETATFYYGGQGEYVELVYMDQQDCEDFSGAQLEGIKNMMSRIGDHLGVFIRELTQEGSHTTLMATMSENAKFIRKVGQELKQLAQLKLTEKQLGLIRDAFEFLGDEIDHVQKLQIAEGSRYSSPMTEFPLEEFLSTWTNLVGVIFDSSNPTKINNVDQVNINGAPLSHIIHDYARILRRMERHYLLYELTQTFPKLGAKVMESAR